MCVILDAVHPPMETIFLHILKSVQVNDALLKNRAFGNTLLLMPLWSSLGEISLKLTLTMGVLQLQQSWSIYLFTGNAWPKNKWNAPLFTSVCRNVPTMLINLSSWGKTFVSFVDGRSQASRICLIMATVILSEIRDFYSWWLSNACVLLHMHYTKVKCVVVIARWMPGLGVPSTQDKTIQFCM